MRAGYYEWHLFIDNNLVYVFDDMEWGDFFTTEQELKDFTDTCLDLLDDEAREDDNEHTGFCDYSKTKQENKDLWLSLSLEERNAVKNAIYNAWLRYCD